MAASQDTFTWTVQNENKLLELKESGKNYKEIAQILGTTLSSVKHKHTRLKQKSNANSHHHPEEKTKQVVSVLQETTSKLFVLETHAGYGNLTGVYSLLAEEVLAYDIDKGKVDYINSIGHENVVCHKADSLLEMHRSIYFGLKFNVIDIDPYGFPSKYFPDIFELIDNGYMFVTIPKYGCSQINNITRLHVKVFWGFEGGNNEKFLKCCIDTLKTSALRTYRTIEIVDVLELDRVYRIAIRVTKENAFLLCGYEHLTKKKNGGLIDGSE